jgi:hypothetical protein
MARIGRVGASGKDHGAVIPVLAILDRSGVAREGFVDRESVVIFGLDQSTILQQPNTATQYTYYQPLNNIYTLQQQKLEK